MNSCVVLWVTLWTRSHSEAHEPDLVDNFHDALQPIDVPAVAKRQGCRIVTIPETHLKIRTDSQ